jgi:predicted O-methyltransferase YrrM
MQTRNSGKTMDYITHTFVDEPAWMKPVRAKGEELRQGMQMSAYEGYLLGWLAKLTGAKSILEVGTFMGGTALWMASSGARVTSLEFNAEYAALAQGYVAASPYAARVTVQQGDALAWLAAQPQQPTFDMLFIDAEKRSYVKYLEAAKPLLQSRALVVADNTLLWGGTSGEVPDAASKESIRVMRSFNAILADPGEYDGIMLPTIEGLTVARLKN